MKKEYNIYALNYAGPLKSSGAFIMWNKDWDKIVERNYYIWCISSDRENIIVDAGVSPQLANKIKLKNYVSPAEMLMRINIKAGDIDKVILSHLHFDHANGVSLFPNATFYIQKDEYHFWTKDPIATRPPFAFYLDNTANDYLKSIKPTGRIHLVEGDQKILPGIECLLTPGHSFANQAVTVNTEKGTAILGSDCGHFFRNYQEDWPSMLIVDLVKWMKSYDKLRSRVSSPDLLFPGHDPLMSQNYPEVAEGVTQLV